MLAVIAFGGNALEDPSRGTGFDENAMKKAAMDVDALLDAGYTVAVTHGNGTQVGELFDMAFAARNSLSNRLDILGAMTQAEIGFGLQEVFETALGKDFRVVLTRVVVSREDPAFSDPTKPIGPFVRPEDTPKGFVFREFQTAGKRRYRMVVPSPKPLDILEKDIIKDMCEDGTPVICCGGGGVPVVQKDGGYTGVNAVVDKDLTASLLARLVGADLLLILTAVDAVMLGYNTPDERPVHELPLGKAEEYLSQGVFEKGTMEPKVEACTEFVSFTGKTAIIGSLGKARQALQGRAGTKILLG